MRGSCIETDAVPLAPPFAPLPSPSGSSDASPDGSLDAAGAGEHGARPSAAASARAAEAEPLTALLVSYAFPPVGGAGVQRVVKMTKYLPRHGVTPRVLTVSNPSVPVLDASLASDVPPEVEVLRARTFEPGYAAKRAAWQGERQGAAPSVATRARRWITAAAKQLLVPDPQILWQPAAQARLARELFGRRDVDVVLVSGPPFSQFLLAPLARLRRGVGVVLDYRDEWSTYRSTYEMMGSRVGAIAGDPLESALLRAAHAVTTATDEFRAHLLERFRFLDPARVHTIPNGYDLDDLPKELPEPPKDRFVVTYAGTVFKLTSARGFLGAVRRLHEREPVLAKRLEVRFIGRVVETEEDAFAGAEALGVQRIGYVEHTRVVRELAASHLALCVLDEVPGVERIYPAKIFELMMIGRPCLTLAPPGALARLVARHSLGEVIAPRDEEAIAAFLERKLREFVGQGGGGAGRVVLDAAPSGIERYDRAALAGELAQVLRQARALANRR